MVSETLYAWDMKAQQWRDDPYYVASSAPIEKVTVVAATRAEAFKELWRVLGPASSHRRWKGWVLGCKDARLIQEATDDR